MDAGDCIRRARARSGLSLRLLAERAGTSHSTLSAYESGAKVPSVVTLERILRAAGFALDLSLEPRVGGPDPDARGRELVEVLELAAMFPARHDQQLRAPIFGRAPAVVVRRRR